jgi:hypothetical protein
MKRGIVLARFAFVSFSVYEDFDNLFRLARASAVMNGFGATPSPSDIISMLRPDATDRSSLKNDGLLASGGLRSYV